MWPILASYVSKITKIVSQTKYGPHSAIVSSPSWDAGILTLWSPHSGCTLLA